MEAKKVHINDLIDNLKVSPDMKEEFKAFNFKFYNNWADGKIKNTIFWTPSPEYLALDKKARRKADMPLSIFGFFLDGFSYLFRGLFLKGFIILALAFLPSILLYFIPNNPSIVAVDKVLCWSLAIYCAIMLRQDYFHKKCLNNRLIKPYILSNQVDFLTERNSQPPEVNKRPGLKALIIVLILLIIFLVAIFVDFVYPTAKENIKEEIRISKLQPDEREYYRHIEKGADFYISKNYEKAIIEYNKAQEIYSEDYLAYGLKASCYSDLKDYDNAILNTKKEIELYEKNPTSIRNKIKYPAAKDEDILLKRLPVMYFALGNAYFEKGDYKEAIKYFNQAIKIKDDGLYYHQRGMAKSKLGDKKGALKDFKVYEKYKAQEVKTAF